VSDPSPKTPANLKWIAALAFCIGLAGYNWMQRLEAIAVERERDSLHVSLLDRQQRKQRLGALVTQARSIQIQQTSEMKELQQLQKKIQTRDQFLVTSGDKIVRQLAVYAPSGERRMLFYVPTGEHRLVYAIREALGSSEEAYALIGNWGDDHRRIPNTTTVHLLGDTVYELRTRVDQVTRKSVTIELIGPANKVVHEDAFALSYQALQGLDNLQNDSEVFASYPNELRSAGETKSHVDAKRSAPVTRLLTFTLDQLGGKDKDSKGRVKMRFWIDSVSPSCVSDLTIAVSYDFLARNLRTVPVPKSTLDGFTKTFQPYDGSGRYYFRDGYFDGTGNP
jgi:hypothetical protein